MTGALLAPALRRATSAAVASIAERLLEEHDIERVEVRDARGAVLFSGSNPRDDSAAADVALRLSRAHRPLRSTTASPEQRSSPLRGALEIWLNRAKMQETLASIQAQDGKPAGHQVKRHARPARRGRRCR